MNQVFVSPNYLLVECIIQPSSGTTATKNPFGTEKQLQNKKVVAIETFCNQDVTNSPISTTNQVVPLSVFNSLFFSAYRSSTPMSKYHDGRVYTPKDREWNSINAEIFPSQNEGLYYDQLPLASMRRVLNMNSTAGTAVSGSRELWRVKPAEFAWTKSYCTSSPAVAITQTYSALFGIHYLNEDQAWSPYM
jgi:hypothetical protein